MGQLSVGIMGAGSIGCYVGGRLLASRAADVTFVGRERVAQELAEHGLTVRDHNNAVTISPEHITFASDPAAVAGCDVIAVSVKSAHTPEVGRDLADLLPPGTTVVSLQNGVRNATTLRESLPTCTVVAGVVDFNVVSLGDGVFHCGLGGGLSFARGAAALADSLRNAGFAVTEHADIASIQWTKLLVNLNNAVSALSDVPTREMLASRSYRRVIAALITEGVATLRTAGIRPAPLRGLPVALMPRILRLPDALAHIVLRAQIRADPHARSSMWEDLTRRRSTEVDFLNGEIVRLGADAGVSVPLNSRMVELVHAAEAAGAGPPGISAGALWDELRAGQV
jgi:2-dehydropantoate 2-reductase